MIWIGLLVVAVIAVTVASRAPGQRPSRGGERRQRDADDPALIEWHDSVEALARFGTDADAQRLIEQGHADDLAGLGWRDGHGRG